MMLALAASLAIVVQDRAALRAAPRLARAAPNSRGCGRETCSRFAANVPDI